MTTDNNAGGSPTRARTLSAATALALCLAGAIPAVAHAAQVNTLYTFSGGTDGNDPAGTLLRDAAGNLFGVTAGGGDSNAGVVFELSPPAMKQNPWQFNRIYSFQGGADGQEPNDGLVADSSGDLLGITTAGGAAGYGTIFVLTPPSNGSTGYAKATLHSFSGGADGSSPYNGLTADGAGNYYGTTYSGGTSNIGTIYKLSPSAHGGGWTLTTVHEFASADGTGHPTGTLTLDASGTLYGTALSGYGAVYSFTPNGKGGGKISVLYAFQGLNDGQSPYGGVALTASGDLVGTTFYAGADTFGTVFQLSPNGRTWQEKTLTYFDGQSCGSSDSKLLVTSSGKIFGTAGQPGCIFSLVPKVGGAGYRFRSVAASPYPTGQLITDPHGNVFGVNQQGPDGFSFGQVYELPGVARH